VPVQTLQALKEFIYKGQVAVREEELMNFTNAAKFLQLNARSILMHPFFKTVNWEEVLQKRVISTVKFFMVDPTHLVTETLEKNPSIENTS
jgi:hypothetical protein